MNVLIIELLLERGDYENELDVEEKDLVSFVFNPIDKSEKIAKESHILSLANAGLLMIDEVNLLRDNVHRHDLMVLGQQRGNGQTDIASTCNCDFHSIPLSSYSI